MNRLRAWLLGLFAGALGGLIVISWGIGLPVLGVVAFAVGAAAPPRPVGLGGALVGLGAVWLALFGRLALTCRPDVGCYSPDLTPWLLGAALAAAAGGILTLAIALRPQRRRAG